MHPKNLEKHFLGKHFSSIDKYDMGTFSEIAKAVVSTPFFGLNVGDTVALKSPKDPTKSARDRLDREARTLDALMKQNVPEIITYHGRLETPDKKVPVLVEELADSNLIYLRTVEYEDNLPIGLMNAIIERVATALSAVHRIGYFHRDIKSSNIYLFHGGLAKLGDFGSAGLNRHGREWRPNLGKGESSGGAHGTPNYNAPEALGSDEEKKHYSISSDLYSLACVGCYLIAGRTPFCDLGLEDDPAELKKAKLEEGEYKGYIDKAIEELVKEKQIPENIPEHKIKAITKALSSDPNDRQKSVNDFLLEYQFGEEEAILIKAYEDIVDLLGRLITTRHGATSIEIVDSFLFGYEKMLQYAQKSGSASSKPGDARKLLEQRALEDETKLRDYIGGQGKDDIPKEQGAERKKFVREFLTLFIAWGNSVTDGKFANEGELLYFSGGKRDKRIRPGILDPNLFEQWYKEYFK